MESSRLVLVVDDDEDIRAALCAVLEEEGYAAVAVANGRAALDYLAESRPPMAILLDLMMPVMDGWQFRSIQLSNPRLAEIPVVVITASGLSNEAAAQLKLQRFLTKPLQLETLFRALKACEVGPHPGAFDRATPRSA